MRLFLVTMFLSISCVTTHGAWWDTPGGTATELSSPNRILVEQSGVSRTATIDQVVDEAAAAPVQSVAGKTGEVSLDKADVGLSNVDNTSDLAKPISTAVQGALDAKADTGHDHDGTYLTTETDPTVPGAISAHEAAADPHPGYVQESVLEYLPKQQGDNI